MAGGSMSISRRDFVKTTAALTPALVVPFTRAQTPAGEGFDYVIAGAGHNSLVCAAYLARAGNRVLVLEGSAMIGGGVKTAEVLLPGYKTDLCATVHGGINQNPLIRDNEIPLRDYGYETIEPDVVVHIPFLDGASFTVYRRDVARTAATIARVSKDDANTFTRLFASRQTIQAMAPAERAGTREGIFWERIGNLSGYDAARQIWESPYMRAPDPQGRIRHAERRAGSLSGSEQRRRAHRQAGRSVDHRGRAMHGRRVSRWQSVSRSEGRRLDDPSQEPDRHGAARALGRRAARHRGHLAARARDVRVPLRARRVAEIPAWGRRHDRQLRSVHHAAAREHFSAEHRSGARRAQYRGLPAANRSSVGLRPDAGAARPRRRQNRGDHPLWVEGRATALGYDKRPRGGSAPRVLLATHREPHEGQGAGEVPCEPARHRADESLDVARQRASQRPRAGCLRALPHADRGPVSNGRLDGAGWLSHRPAGTQRRDRHSAG